MQKKILLIGSNGFIGKNLSIYLKKFFSIYKLNRNVLKENRKNISCDISKKNELKKKFLKFPNFEYVINLSGQVEKNKSKMQNNIYEGNKNLIQIFKKTEATLVFFSTTLVYGHSKNYRNEKSILNPKSDYAKIKVKTEDLYNKTCKKFLILRIGNVYDDQLAKKGLLKNLIGAIKGDTTFIVNKLETVRNYIHIKDLIRIIKIIIDSKKINKTLNIGHQNISNKKMIKIFEKIFKKKIKTKNLRQSYFLDPNIKINSNLIKNKFSYKFKNKIENSIKLNK
ncbi:NAD(P)-dependent oxidoreductase [Candidatus Pelagibacter sp.]|nr:NAD(P)-dependent oxidoreductase [Candidatus Pelagibacter sp.]